MKTAVISILTTLALMFSSGSYALFDKDSPDERREELRKARTAALEKLYQEKPEARDEVKSAKGYAVFSSIGVNLFIVSTESGGGILHNNQTGKDTYMKMFSAGGGLGMGVKDFAVVFIFHTNAAMEDFQKEGWDFSAKAEAGAESNDKGAGTEAAVTVVPGTSIYQMTEAGIALQATLHGTKFWADDELN